MFKHVSFACFILVLLFFNSGPVCQASSDGSEDEPSSSTAVTQEPQEGQFFARVELRDDLERVDVFVAEVKVHPAIMDWPGITLTDKGTGVVETNIRAVIRIRGISVPSQFALRTRPHVQVERERARYDAAIHYVWDLVHNAETLVLENVQHVPKDKLYLCDVYVNIGGNLLDLADMLIADGHACSLQEAQHWDWGARRVRPIQVAVMGTHHVIDAIE